MRAASNASACARRVTEKGVFSETEAAFLTRQVLEGVAYLHSKGIVHRDLKLENILLADSTPKTTIKIADFGLSKVFSASTTLSTVCGSPLYMAPELLTVEQQGDYSPAVDVWSVGVVLFILLAGYSPFGAALPCTAGACRPAVQCMLPLVKQIAVEAVVPHATLQALIERMHVVVPLASRGLCCRSKR